MPQVLPPDIWRWGPVAGLIIAVALLVLPALLSRMTNRDKADQERRDRADKADQERREAAERERREQQTMLIQYLQNVAEKAQVRLDQQTGEFLKSLDKCNQQAADRDARAIGALNDLTKTIDSLQRRQQR